MDTTGTHDCPLCGATHSAAAMTEQPRQPAGVPFGGQFAAKENGEASVALRPLDGSFLYPPIFRDADEVVAFWRSVDIPDDALVRAERVYRENIDRIRDQMPGLLWRSIGTSESQDAYVARVSAALNAAPGSLNRKDVRPVVRATAMYGSAFELTDADERAAVLAAVVETSGGPKTVRQIAEETGMPGYRHVFLDPENLRSGGAPDEAKIREIVTEAVSRASEAQMQYIEEEMEQLTENLKTVGTIIIDAI